MARVDVDWETQRQIRHSQGGEKSGTDINVLKFEGITNSKMLGNEPYSSWLKQAVFAVSVRA